MQLASMASSVEPSTPNLTKNMFKNNVISSLANISKPVMEENQNLPFSPFAQSPVVNKFLSLGRPDSDVSLGSISSSSASPSPVKLKDLPHTTTLRGCVAFVDVWSSDGTDNRSCVFRNFLIRMGATVCKKFTKEFEVTHVVFKDGHKSVLQKAQKRNVKIVTCLWVDRCRVLQKWVDEEEYLFNATSYKPPKRFFEMQPQDPEEAMRRSAERTKRRKARYAKKNARIMFQSPLVTYNYTGTPKDVSSSTPDNDQVKIHNKILVADTPYHPPSPYLFLNPSIVFETPLSESMKRKMQRLKEGKPVFSPPSSDDDSEDSKPDQKLPDHPTATISMIAKEPEEKSNTDRPKFSPIADTQCFMKKSWRESGISPPKFDVSCDEIPETQQMGEEYIDPLPIDMELEDVVNNILPGEFQNHETIHMNEDMELTNIIAVCSQNVKNETVESVKSEEVNNSSSEIQHSIQSSLNLHLSCDSSRSHDNTTLDTVSDAPTEEKKVPDEREKDFTPTEQKIYKKSVSKQTFFPPVQPMSRRRMRKLLADEDFMDPASILMSPKSSSMERESPKRKNRYSMQLPQLGFSSYKTLTKSKFFQRLPSSTPSECSAMSSEQSSPLACSQSTDYDCLESAKSQDEQTSLLDVPVFNEQLGLYDRIKMRNKRHHIGTKEENTELRNGKSSVLKRKRRRNSEDSDNTSSQEDVQKPTKKSTKFTETQANKTLFCSQAAISILQSMKKRRSTMEFKTQMKKPARKPVIVLTNLHSDERFEMHKAVRTLSGFRIASTVQNHTTHVICGAARRTINVLRAISRGVWLLSKNWVTDSLSAGFWLEEESYEMPSLFPVAQRNRRSRNRSTMWRNQLFTKFEGHIYIADDTKPPQEELKELIELCGGTTVGSPRRASVCIGHPGRIMQMMPLVKEIWVLDCISENVLLPISQYLIEPD